MMPSSVRRYRPKLKKYHRLYFTLTITHVKEETEMILQNVGHYRVMEPLFEGLRVILSYLDAVRRSIDAGRPALVWNAFTSMEWDVVCGYDDEEKQFIGRGSYTSWDAEYDRAPWNRAAEAEISFGAIVIGEKKTPLTPGKRK
jgi:hypothetical protein